MDLITVFPHVRQPEHGPHSGGGCDEHARSSKPVERARTTHVPSKLKDEKGSLDCMKRHNAAPARSAQLASCEIISGNSIGQNLSGKTVPDTVPICTERKVQQGRVPKPVTNQRRTKKQGLDGREGESFPSKQLSVCRPKKKMRSSGSSRPSLTLWVLSFVAAVIWMRVFFVEQQPVVKMKTLEMNSIRFAETPVMSYRQEKSRQ